MEKKFHIFVQRHAGGGASVSLLGRPELTAFGPDVGRARADLASALSALLEQDLEHLEAMSFLPRVELRRVDVTLRAQQHRRLLPVPMRVSVLVSPGGAKKQEKGKPIEGPVDLFIPRLGLRESIDDVRDLGAWVEEFVRRAFFMAPLSRLREAAYEGVESVEVLTVAYQPARPVKAEARGASADELDDVGSTIMTAPEGLDEACRSLHIEALVGSLDRAFQRDRELARLTELLGRGRRVGVLLVGPSGAGKTALVHELAARSADKRGPQGFEIYSTSGGRIIAGMRYLGEWQARLDRMIRALRLHGSVLHIESLSEFLSAFPQGEGLDGAGYLGGAVAAGDVSVVVEATPEDLARAERTHPSFIQVFRPLVLEPLSRSEAWIALNSAALRLGKQRRVRFEEKTLRAAMDLSERFFPRAPLPGSAVSLLRSAAQEIDSPTLAECTEEQVLLAFCRRTGFPRSLVDPKAPLDPDEVLTTLQRRVVGQDAALALLRDLIVTLKTALGDPRKPLGSFLLLGPTGVGKTESALALTEFLFGDERRLVRLDMSEFAAPGSAARLVGLYGAEGVLTRRVREQPFGVVLLDEVEKADHGVHDLLLQLLGDGRLTDATGRSVDFTNTIVVMTSNLGAESEGRALGFSGAGASSFEAHYRAAAQRFFRPELLNRIDHVVPYRPLAHSSVLAITRRALEAALAREGLLRRGVAVAYGDELIELLASLGMDARYGARPLKRAIEKRVVAPLAWLLARSGDRPPARVRLVVERGEVTLLPE